MVFHRTILSQICEIYDPTSSKPHTFSQNLRNPLLQIRVICDPTLNSKQMPVYFIHTAHGDHIDVEPLLG
jgi:hypothetical protein